MLLSHKYDKKLSKELKDIAKNTGSVVEVISTDTDEGKQFFNLGGVGAILRFSV